MTNLEHYEAEIQSLLGDSPYIEKSLIKALNRFMNRHSYEMAKAKIRNATDLLSWLCAEYEEPIKLKQWEKDLLEVIDSKYATLLYYDSLMRMRNIGYFKGITDTSMTIIEILENCEIVD